MVRGNPGVRNALRVDISTLWEDCPPLPGDDCTAVCLGEPTGVHEGNKAWHVLDADRMGTG